MCDLNRVNNNNQRVYTALMCRHLLHFISHSTSNDERHRKHTHETDTYLEHNDYNPPDHRSVTADVTTVTSSTQRMVMFTLK